jgi:hypothetical protein
MMEIERLSVEERNQQYKPGSIKRVKLKNFLTYDAVEFFPGPVSHLFYDNLFFASRAPSGGIGAITSNF